MLGLTTRRVRQLCAAGRLTSATDSTGRWLVERDEVTAVGASRTNVAA